MKIMATKKQYEETILNKDSLIRALKHNLNYYDQSYVYMRQEYLRCKSSVSVLQNRVSNYLDELCDLPNDKNDICVADVIEELAHIERLSTDALRAIKPPTKEDPGFFNVLTEYKSNV